MVCHWHWGPIASLGVLSPTPSWYYSGALVVIAAGITVNMAGVLGDSTASCHSGHHSCSGRNSSGHYLLSGTYIRSGSGYTCRRDDNCSRYGTSTTTRDVWRFCQVDINSTQSC